jgi:hypothetical protein
MGVFIADSEPGYLATRAAGGRPQVGKEKAMEPTIIKVKIWGRYRRAELLRRGRTQIDVRVLTQDQTGHCPAYWPGMPITWVRKADRHLCTLDGAAGGERGK